ncbi:MAG TPA: GreA/GreB family elongation factor [Mycobacteriales bacterium]|jgi:transcription elongation factor GreA|nr:GreA/GreB family elongation factor [Mycobacteriales bacterium]
MSVLSPETRGRLQEELTALEAERARLLELVAGTEGKDPADQAERTMREFDVEQVDVRIRRLTDRIDAANKPHAETTHDGTVREGEVVLIDFGDGTPERYLVGALIEVDDDVDAVTPTSPLGRALLGATAGQTVSYRTPQGQRNVKIVAVGDLSDSAAQAS